MNIDEQQNSKLVKITSNPKSPKTEVEDCLNGKVFHSTLKLFVSKYPDDLDFVDQLESIEENISHYALDLRPSQSNKLTSFFDKDDNKVKFAHGYCEILTSSHAIPSWIEEIKNFFK